MPKSNTERSREYRKRKKETSNKTKQVKMTKKMSARAMSICNWEPNKNSSVSEKNLQDLHTDIDIKEETGHVVAELSPSSEANVKLQDVHEKEIKRLYPEQKTGEIMRNCESGESLRPVHLIKMEASDTSEDANEVLCPSVAVKQEPEEAEGAQEVSSPLFIKCECADPEQEDLEEEAEANQISHAEFIKCEVTEAEGEDLEDGEGWTDSDPVPQTSTVGPALGASEDGPILPGSREFQCPRCGVRFTWRAQLKRHVEEVHSGQRYACEHCGREFQHSGTYKAHLLIHTGEQPYSCSVCGKCFSRVSGLNKHHNVHSNERPFKCSQCDAAFSHKPNLRDHEKLHAGVKPYSCDLCGRGFGKSQNLKKHIRTHTGEKPYECKECGQRFSESGSLKNHQFTHSSERTFKCDECGAAFVQRATLLRHQKSHSGVKPYECVHCGKRFIASGDWKRHVRIHEGTKPLVANPGEVLNGEGEELVRDIT